MSTPAEPEMIDLLRYQAAPALLQGRVIALTGATTDVGQSLAAGLAAHGAQLILFGAPGPKLDALHDRIEDQGSHPPVLAELAPPTLTPDTAGHAAARIGEAFGRLDGLLHYPAESAPLTPLELYDLDAWARIMRANFHAVYLLLRAVLPWLKRSADASVVLTSTGVARHGRAYWGPTAVSGAALESLLQVWSDELSGQSNLRFNSLDPGPLACEDYLKTHPGANLAALRTPESLLPAYLYLLAPESRPVRGQQLTLPPPAPVSAPG